MKPPQFFKGAPKKTMPKKDAVAPSADTNETENKIAVILDQDGYFLRVERGEYELEEGADYDLFEEIVEKGENPGTPAPVAKEDLAVGEVVRFTPAVAKLFGAESGTMVEVLPGGVEMKVDINGREEVVGLDSIVK